MSEYEPVNNRQAFLSKWLKEGKPGTEFSVQHVYQLALDIFSIRRGEDWRNTIIPYVDDQEILTHPDGRVIFVTFDERKEKPLSAEVTFFPNEEAMEDYDYSAGYEFLKQKDGSIIVAKDDANTVEEVTLDAQSCATLYRDIMRAHVNTPFKK